MKILIYDKFQDATGIPDEVLSPALADIYTALTTFTATFSSPQDINCIGIGYTDATTVTLTGTFGTINISITKDAPYQNGLYLAAVGSVSSITVSHNGTYIGRVAAGVYRTLGTSPTKEIGFYTTNESRTTLSGQVIPGAGGYSGRRFVATVSYKIDEDVYDDIQLAYPGQIQKGFPYFLLLDDEQHKLPADMELFYAATDVPLSLLQSSVYDFLYSYKFNFYERF